MNKKSAYVMNWRNRTKMKLVEYKGGKCEVCGLDKPIPAIYDFHHVDPSQKEFRIGGTSRSFERLKAETDKCLLVCRNCHSELHWELHQIDRQARLEIKKNYLQPKSCLHCQLMFQPKKYTQVFCSDNCYRLNSRKVERPSKEVLAEDMKVHCWVALGKKYGVSNNAVKKWARQYGLLAI
jgi:hypothetical protein